VVPTVGRSFGSIWQHVTALFQPASGRSEAEIREVVGIVRVIVATQRSPAAPFLRPRHRGTTGISRLLLRDLVPLFSLALALFALQPLHLAPRLLDPHLERHLAGLDSPHRRRQHAAEVRAALRTSPIAVIRSVALQRRRHRHPRLRVLQRRLRVVPQLDGEVERAARGQGREPARQEGEGGQRAAQLLGQVAGPQRALAVVVLRPLPALAAAAAAAAARRERHVPVLRRHLREPREVEDEALERLARARREDDEGDAPHRAAQQLPLDGVDGGVDPVADAAVARLAHRAVVLAGGDETLGRVERAVVEQGMDGDGQEVEEVGDEGEVGGGRRGGAGRRRHGWCLVWMDGLRLE
jgi:hypothetical protein